MGHWYNPNRSGERSEFPIANWLPSVSTILDATRPFDQQQAFKRAALKKPFEFQQRKDLTSERGSTFHEWCGAYLKRELLPSVRWNHQGYCTTIKPFLDSVLALSTAFKSELAVHHESFAGQVDLAQTVAADDFLLDFKTKDKPIHPDALHTAYLQLTGYGEAYSYEFGVRLKSLVVVVVYPTYVQTHKIEPQAFMEEWRNRRLAYSYAQRQETGN